MEQNHALAASTWVRTIKPLPKRVEDSKAKLKLTPPNLRPVEWPTLGIALLCYGGFALGTASTSVVGLPLCAIILTLALTLYSSLNHEVLHGHPFYDARWNTALIFPALSLFIPYPRFRDTHLAHHHDPCLTDPYDDPETNFIDPAEWAKWSVVRQILYRFNNTLFGRITIGPVIGLLVFYSQDAKAIMRGNKLIARAYFFHAAALVPVGVWWLSMANMPAWLFLLCAYFSLSILKIRTFLEHRAHTRARCRSVIIEDRGLLSFLFLKNNLHAVHHACPKMAWYDLDAYYTQRRADYLERNGGYAFRSYWHIARLFLFRSKDPVPHILWTKDGPIDHITTKTQ